MRIVLFTIIFVLSVSFEIYDFIRNKYEVFGIVIDLGQGAKGIDKRRFRSWKKALAYYKECEDKFVSVYICEI